MPRGAQSKRPAPQSQLLIYAYYYSYWIENTEVSKTVWMKSVSITELIWQADTWEEIQTGSEKSEVGRFSTQTLLNSQWGMEEVALHRASTRCQMSLETWMRLLLWCEAEWERNESGYWQRAISWSRAFHMIATCVPWRLYTQRNSPVETLLKIYDKNILKIDAILSLKCF